MTTQKLLFLSVFGACFFSCGKARASELTSTSRRANETISSARYAPSGSACQVSVGKGFLPGIVRPNCFHAAPSDLVEAVFSSIGRFNLARLYVIRTGLSPPGALLSA